MKRFGISLILLLALIINVDAQTTAVTSLNYNALEKKLVKSDADIQNPKKNTKAKTWLERGELFQDINDVNIEFLRPEMQLSELKIYFPDEPKEIKTETGEDGVTREIHVHERINLIIENGVLKTWEETQVIHEEPLKMALKAFIKTSELDADKKLEKNLLESLQRLKKQAETKGIMAFTSQDYENAHRYFALCAKTGQQDVFEGGVDTVIYYNAGLAAVNAKMYDEAIEYFQLAKKYNYGGENLYYYLKNVYIEKGDSANAEKTLQEGFKNLGSNLMVFELINFYLTQGKSVEALEYLKLGLEADPSNKTLYFALGTTYDQLDEHEEALKAYKKAIELDNTYYDAYYNLGVMYYNTAVELYKQANNETDNDKYNALREEADEVLKNAVEPMERASEIEGGKVEVWETLKTIYYRLQMDDKRQAAEAKVQELTGAAQ
jgi:tetratricopeptide (TPR) repeat protein